MDCGRAEVADSIPAVEEKPDRPRWLVAADDEVLSHLRSHRAACREVRERERAYVALRRQGAGGIVFARLLSRQALGSIHLADVGVRSALGVLRQTRVPASTPGLRYATTVTGVPLGAGVMCPRSRAGLASSPCGMTTPPWTGTWPRRPWPPTSPPGPARRPRRWWPTGRYPLA